jgi:hypothetical protein
MEEHIVIIAGSRDLYDMSALEKAISEYPYPIDTIITGGASGMDECGKRFALDHGLDHIEVLPEWKKFGMRAGFIRNEIMAKTANGLILIHHNSKGSLLMRKIAEDRGLIIVEAIL